MTDQNTPQPDIDATFSQIAAANQQPDLHQDVTLSIALHHDRPADAHSTEIPMLQPVLQAFHDHRAPSAEHTVQIIEHHELTIASFTDNELAHLFFAGTPFEGFRTIPHPEIDDVTITVGVASFSVPLGPKNLSDITAKITEAFEQMLIDDSLCDFLLEADPTLVQRQAHADDAQLNRWQLQLTQLAEMVRTFDAITPRLHQLREQAQHNAVIGEISISYDVSSNEVAAVMETEPDQ